AEHVAGAQPLLDRAAAIRQIAAAIAADDPAIARLVRDVSLDGAEQDLGRQPALREHDRRDPLPEEAGGDLRRLAEVRRANAELGIHDRRVVAHEELVPRGRAALRDLFHALADDPLRQLSRVADGRRGHDELWRRAVVAAEAAQATNDVGEVAAED